MKERRKIPLKSWWRCWSVFVWWNTLLVMHSPSDECGPSGSFARISLLDFSVLTALLSWKKINSKDGHKHEKWNSSAEISFHSKGRNTQPQYIGAFSMSDISGFCDACVTCVIPKCFLRLSSADVHRGFWPTDLYVNSVLRRFQFLLGWELCSLHIFYIVYYQMFHKSCASVWIMRDANANFWLSMSVSCMSTNV